MTLYAHTGPDLSDRSTWQTLQDHASEVGRLAFGFASRFGMGEWGWALGILHDAGKASSAFQRRLAGAAIAVDHSTAGAKEAVDRYGAHGTLMAYALAGHHGGQPNGMGSSNLGDLSSRTPLDQRLARGLEPYEGFLELLASGDLTLPEPDVLSSPRTPDHGHWIDHPETPNFFSFYVLGRMLYSCLVDADGLDAERVMMPEAARVREGCAYATLHELLERLQHYLSCLDAPDTPVNRARAAVLEDCMNASDAPPGLFALTVPTGGGKTLSALAFALKHAIAHGMDRVIIAAPFTTIISQTASQLKGIFGAQNVLEHHSNYDLSDLDEEEGYAARLVSQNWDAPIIVTTKVQLLESLFASKPGKSRKIHNIANSVVILDEAQTLPDSQLRPSLAMLEELAFAYNTSIVLCSATQPALGMHWPYGSHVRDIVARSDELREAFGSRVHYCMLGSVEAEDLASDMAEKHQVLCVVGTKGNALAMYLALVEAAVRKGILEGREQAASEGFFHLSAFMTPAHRDAIIVDIRERLQVGERCFVVSTQLIEAGVDVDFPEVYREVAGMDSIVQAAGRCNREGIRESGYVCVFDLLIDGERGKTSPWLEGMRNISLDLIDENDGLISEALVPRFFARRYQNEELDAKGIFEELSSIKILEEGFANIPFERTALDYRIIEEDAVPVFVPFEEEGRALLRELHSSELSARLAMEVQRHSVSIPRWLSWQYREAGAVEELDSFLILREEVVTSFYRGDVGLLKPGEEEPELLFL